MIELEDFKKKLGPKATQLSNQEVEKLRDWQYKLANILFDVWNKEEKKAKVATIIVTHKKNGNLVDCLSFGFIYARN